MGRRTASSILGRMPRSPRSVPDGKDGDEAFVDEPEADRVAISTCDGAPNVRSVDHGIAPRARSDASDGRSGVRPDVPGHSGIEPAMMSTDPRKVGQSRDVVSDLHASKAATATSTSSSGSDSPAKDCARPRSIGTPTSSLRRVPDRGFGEGSVVRRGHFAFGRVGHRLWIGRVHAIQSGALASPRPDVTQTDGALDGTVQIPRTRRHP